MTRIATSTPRSPAVRLTTLGCDIELTCSGDRAQEALTAVEDAWEWCLASPHTIKANPLSIELLLDNDPQVVNRATERGAIAATDLHVVMHLLSQAVTLASVDNLAGSMLMLHACAIADPSTGRALAVVAGSGTGKTTFATTFGPGRIYLTDETVAVTQDQRVVPYPKPLSVHSPKGLKDQIAPRSFDMLPPDGTATLASLWFLVRTHDDVAPSFTALSTLDAVVALSPQISYLSALAHPLSTLADTIESVGGAKIVVYHEVADLSPFVDQELAAQS